MISSFICPNFSPGTDQIENSASGDVEHKRGGGGRRARAAQAEASEGHEGGGGKLGRAALPRFEHPIRYEKHWDLR